MTAIGTIETPITIQKNAGNPILAKLHPPVFVLAKATRPPIIRQDACDDRFAPRDDSADWGSKSYCRPCRGFRRDTSENCACCNVRKNQCPPQTVRTKRLHIHNRLHCSAQLPLRVRGTPEKLFFACSIPRVIDDWNSTRTLRRAAVSTITLRASDSATGFWRPPEMKRW